jgi:hypothetical protein
MNANMNNASNSNSNSNSQAMPRKIVGAEWVTTPARPWWVPPGLEATQGPGAKPIYYRSPFFGAEREWKNDDDGWQLFQTRRSKQQQRRAYRNHNDNNHDTYDFDDSY